MSFAVAACQILYFAEWVCVFKMGRGELTVRHLRTQIHEVAMIIVAGYNPIVYLIFNGTMRKDFCNYYFQFLKRYFRRNSTGLISVELTSGNGKS